MKERLLSRYSLILLYSLVFCGNLYAQNLDKSSVPKGTISPSDSDAENPVDNPATEDTFGNGQDNIEPNEVESPATEPETTEVDGDDDTDQEDQEAKDPKAKDTKAKEKETQDTKPKFAGVPIPIVNPTVGWGLGAMVMLAYPLNKEDTVSPHSSSMLYGMGSSNKSWAIFGAQRLYFKQDDYRASIAGGYGDFKSNYYGTGSNGELAGLSLPMRTAATFARLRFQRRVIDRFYAGAQYQFTYANVTVDISDVPVPDAPQTVEQTTLDSGIGAVLEYDSRDSQFSATKGYYISGTTMSFAKAFGGDINYSLFDLAINAYFPITSDKYVIAARAFGAWSTENTPVYSQPLIGKGADLRGYDHGRYRNDMVLTTQVEFRWNFVWRFGLVVFGGFGTASEYGNMEDAPFLGTYGGGLRFNLHPKQRMMLRVDYGRGNDTGYFYFGLNEAF